MNDLNERIKDIRIPVFMRNLPISKKGFPIPWFVQWMMDGQASPRPGYGEPDFRYARNNAALEGHLKRLCWICGNRLVAGSNAFVIGPMCAVNRVSSEPPSHYNCAQYAVKACPFLVQPRMTRNEKNISPDKMEVEGMIKRNPGVSLIWMTRSYKVHAVDNGVLFEIGAPTQIFWLREGRAATRAEVEESINSGLPDLYAKALEQGLVDKLPAMIEQAKELYPK